jgi:hypothetical protein
VQRQVIGGILANPPPKPTATLALIGHCTARRLCRAAPLQAPRVAATARDLAATALDATPPLFAAAVRCCSHHANRSAFRLLARRRPPACSSLGSA